MKDLFNTYICIACRLDSNRLPRKALRLVDDIPVIELLVTRLLTLFNPSNIIICTSNESINEPLRLVSQKYNIGFFSGDKLDVMGRFINASCYLKHPKSVVRVTGDNPLTDVHLMYDMISNHNAGSYEYTFTSAVPRGLRCEVIDFEYLKDLHTRIVNTSNTEYMTHYLKLDTSKKLHFLPDISWNNLTFTIDTQDQLEFVSKVVAASPNKYLSTTDELVDTTYMLMGKHYTNVPPEAHPLDLSSFRFTRRT